MTLCTAPASGHCTPGSAGKRLATTDSHKTSPRKTWLRAIEHSRRHGLPDNPDAWLHRVARNLLVSHYRRVGREVPSDNDAPAACDEASPEERVAVRQTLGWLGASRALLLRAFHIEGRTTAELAADTGLSERAVEGRPPAPPRYPGARGSAHGA